MTDEPMIGGCSTTKVGPTVDALLIEVTPEQFITGWPIGVANQTPLCTGCNRSLRTGETCTVYAYRPVDGHQWYLTRSFCRECAPSTIETPTLGTAELLATSRLGTLQFPKDRSHRAALVEVEVFEYSPSEEGTQP